jgi:hypothetical protein
MTTGKRKRRQLFVDPKVQGALVLRVVLYWAICVVAIALMLLCWRIITGPARLFYTHFDAMWFHYGPVLVASFFLLPLVVYDIVEMSNRFCGPLFRLRRSMRALARGEHVNPISFREGDYWPEFAQEFNALLARIQRETSPEAQPPEPESDEAEKPVAAGIE